MTTCSCFIQQNGQNCYYNAALKIEFEQNLDDFELIKCFSPKSTVLVKVIEPTSIFTKASQELRMSL
jgi:hypothetical protein